MAFSLAKSAAVTEAAQEYEVSHEKMLATGRQNHKPLEPTCQDPLRENETNCIRQEIGQPNKLHIENQAQQETHD
jgi:hypothetical protein